MKKSIFTLALLSAIMSMPMSMKAESMVNTQHEGEMYHHHHHHHDGGGYCASEQQVNDLLIAIQNTPFQSDKMNVAMSFLRQCPMSVDGIRRVASKFAFNSDKKDFLMKAFPYCANPAEYYQLRDVLVFNSDKDELMRYVDRYVADHSSSYTVYYY